MYGSSYYNTNDRQLAAAKNAEAQRQHQMASRQYAETQGFAQRQAAEEAARQQAAANDAMTGFTQHEQAAQADREMRMAEREQQLKYEQMARETAARQSGDAMKYKAMNNMTNMMPGISGAIGGQYGQPKQQVPGVNLFGRNGQRIGGSSIRDSLLG
jgi:hypothetical protein